MREKSELGFEPKAVGWEAWTLPLCYAVCLIPQLRFHSRKKLVCGIFKALIQTLKLSYIWTWHNSVGSLQLLLASVLKLTQLNGVESIPTGGSLWGSSSDLVECSQAVQGSPVGTSKSLLVFSKQHLLGAFSRWVIFYEFIDSRLNFHLE